MKRIPAGCFQVGCAAVVFMALHFRGVGPTEVIAADSGAPSSVASGDSPVSGLDPLTGRDPETAIRQGACLVDPAALEDFQIQREKLAVQAKALSARESELKAREQAVTDELKKLEEIRASITKSEIIQKKESEEKVAKIVDMMQTMSPKAAAKVINELDEALAVAAMDKMETAKLAKIMNNLEPKKSSRLSEVLAGVARARDTAGLPRQELARAQTGSDVNRAVSSTQSGKGGERDDGHNQSK